MGSNALDGNLRERETHLRNKRAVVEERLRGEMPDAHRAYKVRAILPAIAAAFKRIAAGTYGACVDCGGTIPRQRLERFPEAARCVPCQEVIESCARKM